MLLNYVIIHKKAVIVSGFLSDDSGSELHPLFLRYTGIFPYRYMYCVFFASWGSLIRFRIMADSGMLLGSHTLPSRVSTDILKLRCSRHRVENVRHWSNIIRIRPKILHNTHSQCGGREWVPAFFCLKMRISVFRLDFSYHKQVFQQRSLAAFEIRFCLSLSEGTNCAPFLLLIPCFANTVQ